MIVETPDGQVQFPDSMSPDDIQNVLRQKYGFKGAQGPPAQPAPAPAQGSPTPSPGATSAPISPVAPGGAGQGPQGQDLGSTAFWNKPAGASWSDYLLAHLAKQGQGFGQAADDYVRAATDTATFGQADRLAAYMNGTNLADERAQTQAAHQRLGAGDYIANAAGYLPLGELGIAGKLGGGLLGMTGEGAALGAAGAAGHDQNITGGAIAGGVGGLAGGAASKAIINPVAGALANKLGMGADVNAAAGDITSSLKDTRDAAYDKLKDVFYKPNDLLDALDQTKTDIFASDPGGDLWDNAPRSKAAFNALYTRAADTAVNPTQTAHGILTTMDKLNDIQRSPGGPENDIAPIIKDRLNNFLQTANPVNPNLGPGDAANMLEAAKAAHQQYANASDLQQWAQSLRGFGASPAGQAQNVAESFYRDPNSPQYQALSNIANAGGAPGGQNAYSLVHGLVHPAVETAAMATMHPAVAVPVAAAATFLGAKPAINAAMGAGSKASQLNAIYKAYPTMTGQQFTPPGSPDAGAALRALILGRAASNQRPF
jgi:hypothetical protein